MRTKCTPEPWLRDGTTVYALDETGKSNRFFAQFQGGFVRHPDDHTLHDELIANATLAHAARDLLEALERLVFALDMGDGEFLHQQSDMDFARAAIAKAKGVSDA